MFKVFGNVSDASRRVVAGVRVQAFDRDMRSEEFLGEAVTDGEGRYAIEYSAEQIALSEKKSADLLVRVVDGKGVVIAESKTVFNAAPEQAIDLQLSLKQYRGPSEYERYGAELVPLVGKVPVADLTDKDIEFLAHETGISSGHLRFLQLDAAWSKSRGIQPAVFYGLFRQGLTTNYPRLLAEKPSRLEKALKASVEQNLIPPSIGETFGDILARLEELAIDAASEHEDPQAPAPAGKLLSTTKLDPAVQTDLIRFSLSYEGERTKFWEAAKESLKLDDTSIGEARFSIEAGALVSRHLATLQAVQQLKLDKGWTDARDLAQLSRDDWNGVVEGSTANGVPEGFKDPNAYAEAIAYGIEQTMPTAVFAHNVSGSAIGSADVDTFFAQNSDFDLVHNNVDGYFENGVNLGGIGDPDKVREQVKGYQRIVRLVPRQQFYGTAEAVMKAGHTSGLSIHAKGKRRFKEDTAAVIDPDIADAIFGKAQVAAGVTIVNLHNARDFFDSPGPVFPGFRPETEPDTGDMPEWVTLFGNVSGCACAHCRSVYGPAAYLADLLKFMDDAPTGAVYNLVHERRPDIEHLLLNCDNANTPLPHIDIVNEILGDALAGIAPVARQTEGTAEALRAEPAAHTENATARDLIKAAEFPWTLPFDADHERAKLFAEHLGLDLAALWNVFGRPDEEGTRAELGLCETLFDLLAAEDVSDATVGARWGSAATTVAELSSLPTLLDRSGLSFDELEVLLTADFLASDGGPVVTLDRGGDPCNLDDDTLTGLTWALLDQIQRFVRLSRHLGWPLERDNCPLDAVLKAFEHRSLNAAVLADVVRVRKAARTVRRAAADLVALDAAGLAGALRTTTVELDLFAQMVGADLATAEGILTAVEKWPALTGAGVTVRDLAYSLFGWDQTPAALTPRDEDVDAFLAQLHSQAAAAAADDLDATLADNVARYVATEADVIAALLANLAAPSDPTLHALEDFRSWAQAAVPAGAEPVRQLVFGLHRIARLTTGLGLDAGDLPVIVHADPANGFLDFNALVAPPVDLSSPATPEARAEHRARFDAWQALAAASALRHRLPRGDVDLFDLLGDSTLDSAHLAEATGWAAADIDAIAGASADFSQVETFARLAQAMSWIRRYDTDGAELATWASASAADLAADLRGNAKARFAGDTDPAWYAVLTPISDRVREKNRDALLAYLIAPNPDGTRRFAGANEVYAHYLIDVEMASCQQTSRIVQATAAIQLLVQRLLMNIETVRLGNPDSEHWQQWAWRKNYRVWEANRKVFLYPENWLEPELRDTKTPFFRDLENELLQDDLTDETAERAYRHYLTKLDEVAHLDVRGLYHEEDRNILHVVARTHAVPHTYYYRKRIGERWTPWEIIDMQIEGDHLLPVVHEGRLILFWVLFKEDQRSGDGSDEDNRAYWRITMAWSERRDGRWQARQTGSELSLLATLTSKDDYCFKAYAEDGGLSIRVFARHRLLNDAIISIMRLRFDPCTRALIEDHAPVRAMLAPPSGTRLAGMEFVEDPELSGDELSATLRLGESDIAGVPEEFSELAQEGGLLGIILAAFLAAGDLAEQWDTFLGTRNRVPLLDVTPGTFSILPAHQFSQLTGATPFCVKVDGRTWLVTQEMVQIDLGYGFSYEYASYRFESIYHPYMCAMNRVADREGLDGLLSGSKTRPGEWPARQLPQDLSSFLALGPSPYVASPRPLEDVDFSLADANSAYNWEIFFHIPLLVATRLSKNGQFEEAQKWFHYIFDPTDVSDLEAPARYWKVKPFYQEALDPPETIRDLMQRLAGGFGDDVETQIETWENDPFDPHAIARLRTLAYMRSAVMKYLDNLIAWGDSLFQRNTRESINESAQLYVLAAEILGKRPVTLSRKDSEARDFATVRNDLDDFSNALVDLESGLPADLPSSDSGGGSGTGIALPAGVGLYFCIPGNEKLAGYWDTVGDRLFKIRHCMNLEGQVQQLPLFAPPIDPGLLVRATAMGLDLRQVLAQIESASLPSYRYSFVYQKALELTGDVRAFGNALLSSLEKKDAEDLALLRARHEASMLDQIRAIKNRRVNEAEDALDGLTHTKAMAEARREYYSSRDKISAGEEKHLALMGAARDMQAVADGLQMAASISYLIPQLIASFPPSIEFGGAQLGGALNAVAQGFGFVAAERQHEGTKASLVAGYQRRQDDWDFQAGQAEIEIKQIEKQILAAEIRLAIAEKELDNHDLQIEQARETEDFLRRKFTNAELYGWMSSQLAALHHEAYRMAYDMAMKAQSAAQHHLGVEAGEFQLINFGHWDSQKKGLLAGERLLQDLRRMDAAFMEQNERREEITKHISLRALDPRQLVELRETGSCTFTVPEMLFDLDFPGHVDRRIKSVSLTIPCVAGPYTSISARLTLSSSKVTAKSGSTRAVSLPTGLQAIATSTAQNDSGLFELNFRDERWLPFEGAGADSTWTLELPAVKALRAFDYDTISDVLLHMRYSATYDSGRQQDVEDELKATINEWLTKVTGSGSGFYRLISLRQEFATELYRFLHPAAGATAHTAEVTLERRHFPQIFDGNEKTLKEVTVVFKPTTTGDATATGQHISMDPPPLDSDTSPTLEANAALGDLPAATFAGLSGSPIRPYSITMSDDPGDIEDIFLLVRYEVTVPADAPEDP